MEPAFNFVRFVPLDKEQINGELYPFIESERAKIKAFNKDNPIYGDVLDIESIDIMASSISSSIVIGFYLSNILVGYALILWNPRDGQSALHLIYIEKMVRNRGIGQGFLKQFPVKEIDLDASNEQALNCYLGAGFFIATSTENSITVKRKRAIKQDSIDNFQITFDIYQAKRKGL